MLFGVVVYVGAGTTFPQCPVVLFGGSLALEFVDCWYAYVLVVNSCWSLRVGLGGTHRHRGASRRLVVPLLGVVIVPHPLMSYRLSLDLSCAVYACRLSCCALLLLSACTVGISSCRSRRCAWTTGLGVVESPFVRFYRCRVSYDVDVRRVHCRRCIGRRFDAFIVVVVFLVTGFPGRWLWGAVLTLQVLLSLRRLARC